MLSKGKSNQKSENKMQAFTWVKVERCHDFGNGRISFNASFGMGDAEKEEPLIRVYGLTWVEGTNGKKEYKFISMPQRKGSDGNYYNECYISITDELLDQVEMQLGTMLNN